MNKTLDKILTPIIITTGIAATVIFTDTKNTYAETRVGTTGKESVSVFTPYNGSGGYTSDGNHVTCPQGPTCYDSKGNTIIRPYHKEEETKPETPTQEKTTQQLPYAAIDEKIKQDPTNAKLYIQKVDLMRRNKAQRQEIINTLEDATKYELKGLDTEKAVIYQELSSNYYEIGKIRKAYQLILKVKNLDPSYPNVDYSIREYKKILNLN